MTTFDKLDTRLAGMSLDFMGGLAQGPSARPRLAP